MKTCGRCGEAKPRDAFYRKTATQYQSYCKSCFNAYCVERWRQRKIAAIEHLGGVCQDCGYHEHPAAMQFHHLREKDVSWTKLRLRSWERIVEELDKCVLLCANCHAIRHSDYVSE